MAAINQYSWTVSHGDKRADNAQKQWAVFLLLLLLLLLSGQFVNYSDMTHDRIWRRI